MSAFQFIASNEKLDEINNEKLKSYSVAESIDMGYSFNQDLIKDVNINDDSSVLIGDNDAVFDELVISKDFYYDISDARKYTDKTNIVQLDWRYSEDRASVLIDYIKKHLEYSTEIELWNTWLNDYQKPRITIKIIDMLTIVDLEKIFNKDSFDIPECLIIKK